MMAPLRLLAIFARALIVVSTAMPLTVAAQTSKNSQRVALVIGNSVYPDSDTALPSTIGDARSIAQALQSSGFTVEKAENATKAAMNATVDRFVSSARRGFTGLVFFSGHGVQVSGQNYLIPVDARIWSEADVLRDGVSVKDILAKLADKGADTRVVILDASRRNPFERRFRSYSAGLAPAAPEAHDVYVLSTGPGTVATDGAAAVSPFGSELASAINMSRVSAIGAFESLRDKVARTSQNRQVPTIFAGNQMDFSFDETFAPVVSAASPPLVVAPAQKVAEPAPKPEPPVKKEIVVAKAPDPAPSGNLTIQPVAKTPPVTDKKIETNLVGKYSGEDQALVARLDKIIASNPRNGDARFQRGQILAEHGDYGSALVDFDELVRDDPKNVDGLNNSCFLRAIRNEMQRALADCNEVLKLRPSFAEALDSRALVYLKLGNLKFAIADYDAALRIKPKHASALYGRGIARLRSDASSQAESDFQAALAIDPKIDQEYKQYGLN